MPELGFGVKPDHILEWLRINCAQGFYAFNANSPPGSGDAMSFYFKSQDDAQAFSREMAGLGVCVGGTGYQLKGNTSAL